MKKKYKISRKHMRKSVHKIKSNNRWRKNISIPKVTRGAYLYSYCKKIDKPYSILFISEVKTVF